MARLKSGDFIELIQRVHSLQRRTASPEEAEEEYRSVRTDLAVEATELYRQSTGVEEIPGARIETRRTENASVTRTTVLTPQAAQALGKLPGNYVTIESESLRTHNRDAQEEVGELLAEEIGRFMTRLEEEDTVLLVGLGNWDATPDALGPRTIHHALITRHLFKVAPPELRGGLRPVCGIAPGVLGITGMETGEIVKGIVERIRPAMVIAIDALAARNTKRICATIQISDTGIHPGSGLGNKRVGITPESLGIPVIAIGVPTVVHAATIVTDALDRYWEMQNEDGDGDNAGRVRENAAQARFPNLAVDPRDILHPHTPSNAEAVDGTGVVADGQVPRRFPLTPDMLQRFLDEILSPLLGPLVVTPKEIDVVIEDVARILAGGINVALHPKVDVDEMLKYLQ